MSTIHKTKRLFFLDNLKVFFVLLVIFYHAAVTYGVVGWWYYIAAFNENNPTSDLDSLFFMFLTIFGALFQASLMGLFFLLGGYFTPGSYDRKGPQNYWKERLIRLGTPLILYIVIVDPFMVYSLAIMGIKEWSTYPVLQGTFLDFYLSRFQSIAGIIEFFSSMGPMWFLLVLLIFTLGYTIWRQVSKQESIKEFVIREHQIPRILLLFLLSLGLGLITFIIRLFFPVGVVMLGIPLAFITQYTMMFIVGVIAYRGDWFQKIENSQTKTWIIIIIASAFFFVFYIVFIFGIESDFEVMAGSFTLHALVYALVDNIICIGMIFVLIPIFRDRFDTQGNVLRNLSSNAYIMYLIHAPVLVGVSIILASIQFLPLIKLLIAFPLSALICLLLSHFILRRIL
ncbi:MAG: acyltransferase family protein [Candidatus Hodarchaeota archaeon]